MLSDIANDLCSRFLEGRGVSPYTPAADSLLLGFGGKSVFATISYRLLTLISVGTSGGVERF